MSLVVFSTISPHTFFIMLNYKSISHSLQDYFESNAKVGQAELVRDNLVVTKTFRMVQDDKDTVTQEVYKFDVDGPVHSGIVSVAEKEIVASGYSCDGSKRAVVKEKSEGVFVIEVF